MTDTAREPQERMPVITEKHVRTLADILAQRLDAEAEPVICKHVDEILALVRFFSSEEVGIYDTRTEVKVSRYEIESSAAMLAKLADGKREDTVVFSRLYDLMNRWLASPATPEKESERCPYGCPPERASACCEACWPAASPSESGVRLDLDANERTTVHGIAARVRAYKSAMWADRDFQLLLDHLAAIASLESRLASVERERNALKECLTEAHAAYFSGIGGGEDDDRVFMETNWVPEAEDLIGWGKSESRAAR